MFLARQARLERAGREIVPQRRPDRPQRSHAARAVSYRVEQRQGRGRIRERIEEDGDRFVAAPRGAQLRDHRLWRTLADERGALHGIDQERDGLGSPAALYLAAAGVGTLGIVDNDVVDVSNLQRQVIHSTERVGVPKVDSAEDTIRALNPDVHVQKYALRLGPENIMDILPGYDIVVDGLDNFPTRYLLNDASVRLQLPVVSAAILGFEGQLSVFKPYDGPCYRCLFPVPPPAELAPSCGANGVLGVLPGTMGLLQATEVIKLILGEGESLIGRLLMYDALAAGFTEVKVRRDPDCPICSRHPEAISDEEMGVFPDYEAFCAGAH